MNRLTLLTVILAFPLISVAQNSPKSRNWGSELYLLIGGEVTNYTGINGSLRNVGMNKTPGFLTEAGFGVAIRYRQFLFGVEDALIGSSSVAVPTTGFHDRFYFAANVIHFGHCILSPELGYVYENLTMRIQKPTGATNFEDALTNGANELQLNHYSDLLDVGVELKIKGVKPNQVLPIVRAGYRFGLDDPQWIVSNSTVTDGPRDRGGNVYVDLVLGFGY